MKRHLLVGLVIVSQLLAAAITATQADEASDKLAQAYEAGRQAGYQEGWADCQSHHCGAASSGSIVSGTTIYGSGTYMNYQIPKIFVGGGTSGSKPIPDDWLISPSETGANLIGHIDTNGSFQPYVIEKGGKIGLLPENQVPLWTTDDATKMFLQSLPKGVDGRVFVPIEPSVQ
jgi:hypothetical protein